MKHVAVVDIGSNSIKMTIAKVTSTHCETVYVFKEALRLLEEHQDHIHVEKIEQLLAALAECKNHAQRYNAEITYFATDALRRASNQCEVLHHIHDKLDVDMEIVPPEKEAELVLIAHRHLFDLQFGEVFVVDVGGGSVELMMLHENKSMFQTSMGLGAIRVKSMFEDASYTQENIERVFFAIQDRLKKENVPQASHQARVFVSGGNPSAVAKMNLMFHQIHFEQLHGESIYIGELNELIKKVSSQSTEWIAKTFQIKPHRADLAVPTIVLLGALIDYIDVEQYTVSKTGIREGELIRQMKDLQ